MCNCGRVPRNQWVAHDSPAPTSSARCAVRASHKQWLSHCNEELCVCFSSFVCWARLGGCCKRRRRTTRWPPSCSARGWSSVRTTPTSCRYDVGREMGLSLLWFELVWFGLVWYGLVRFFFFSGWFGLPRSVFHEIIKT